MRSSVLCEPHCDPGKEGLPLLYSFGNCGLKLPAATEGAELNPRQSVQPQPEFSQPVVLRPASVRTLRGVAKSFHLSQEAWCGLENGQFSVSRDGALCSRDHPVTTIDLTALLWDTAMLNLGV